MAIETEQEVRRRIQQVAPGAVFTSGRRTPERNRAVGGVPNSLHTREGEDGGARALDLVPGTSGLSMAELNARVGQSGLHLQERLNEGDHVHVGFDGRSSGGGGQEPGQPGYRVTASDDLRPGEAQRLLASGEYQIDPNDPTRIFRVVGREDAPILPAPLDNAYAERQAARESLALDQEEAEIIQAAQPQEPRGAETWLTTLFGATSANAATGGLEGLILGETGATLDRSMGERFVENLDDAFQRSGAGYLNRQLDPNANEFDLADIWHQPEILDGKPLDWVLDRVLGEDRGYLRSVNDETRSDAPQIAKERERRAEYASRAAADPVRNAGDAIAAIGGQVAGAAVSPENWVAPGRTLAGKVAGNAAVAGATDGLLQAAEIGGGVRDQYDPVQTAGAAAIGGALPAVHAIVQRAVVARRAQAAARGLQADPVMRQAEAVAEGEAMQAAVREALGNPEGPRFRVRPEAQGSQGVDRAALNAEADAIRTANPEANIDNNARLLEIEEALFESQPGRAAPADPVIVPFQSKIDAADADNVVGDVPVRGVAPAFLGNDGKVYTGTIGTQHFSAATEASRAAGVADTGFVDPAGRFLTRAEALDYVNANGEVIKPNASMPGELDALDYREQSAFARNGEMRPVGITPRDITTSTDNVFDINLARINTPEDVQAVIVGMADRMAKDVDLARRGTRSWDQTREAANGVDWVESMGQRRVGQALNAEEITAYRLALNSSATKLDELAEAVETNPTLANQFVMRRAAAVHSAIQNEFFGARAEAGRALNAFKIPADAPATYLRQIDSLIADMGGATTGLDLARAIRQAKQNGDIELNEMLRGGGAMARSREILKLVWTNGKLSALGTPIWNILGNASLLGLNVATRAVAPRFARAFGGNATTQVGEAAALVHGYQSAFRDMIRLTPMQAAQRIGDNAGEALRREGVFRGMAPGIDDAAPANIMLRAEREEAGSTASRPLAAAAWRVSEDSTLGRALDVFQMIVEAPSNINALSDDFFKVVAARGELHAQAFRRVASEGVEGEAARARYAELMLNPTDDMLKAAEKEMHELTLTRHIGPRDHAGGRETAGRTTAQSFLDLRASWDSAGPIPFGSMIFPFIKTPANLISAGMRYSPLAPLSRRFRNDIAAGGARAETAKAQIAVGTALWSVWMGMAMDGDLTGGGPGNRGQREAMQRVDEYGGTIFQPYSVRVGDRWISYERGDPIAQGMSLVADMADLLKNGDWDNEQNGEGDEIAAHVVMSLGQAFFNKTMLKGASEISAALLDGKVADAERLLKTQLAGMVPFSGALRTARRADDVYMRETANAIDALRNITPGLSDDLPPQRDLWGRERRYYSAAPTEAVMNVIGFQSRGQGGSAIDLEILNNGVSVAMPSRSISVAGETVSLKNRPDIYSEFIRLAGEPAFEQLNAVAEGRHPDSEFYYSLTDGPGGGKAEYIREVVSAYRAEARAAVTEMYASDLQAMAADRVRRREEARAVE